MNDKLGALLGFASKSGSLSYGFEESMAAARRGIAKGVFFADDISAKSRKEILFHCDRLGVSAYELNGITMNELSHSIGEKCAVIALTNDSFYKPIISYLMSDI